MAHIIMDVVLLVVAIVIIVKFTVTGFFKSVLNSFKLLISVALAFILKNPVAALASNLFMRKLFVNVVTSSLASYIESNEATTNIFLMLYSNDENNFYNSVLADFGVDLAQLDKDFQLLKEGEISAISSLGDNIGGAMSSMVCSILAVVAVFALSMIALSLLIPLLNKLTEFDGIKAANRLLGFLVGVVISLLVLWGASVGIYALTDLIGPFTPGVFDKETVNNSMIVSLFRNLNLVEWISGLILK